eukprot:TRINITY_DN7289_c0_g1_i1.p1 TRINITY_DN7289_c0_g1~~TRINITY_DN7289_c0_g1_i1.p1  ORF type:complete len:904 (+),score=189.21 TRINITY_DN7289_c0_g1_i1:68-2779(+)
MSIDSPNVSKKELSSGHPSLGGYPLLSSNVSSPRGSQQRLQLLKEKLAKRRASGPQTPTTTSPPALTRTQSDIQRTQLELQLEIARGTAEWLSEPQPATVAPSMRSPLRPEFLMEPKDDAEYSRQVLHSQEHSSPATLQRFASGSGANSPRFFRTQSASPHTLSPRQFSQPFDTMAMQQETTAQHPTQLPSAAQLLATSRPQVPPPLQRTLSTAYHPQPLQSPRAHAAPVTSLSTHRASIIAQPDDVEATTVKPALPGLPNAADIHQTRHEERRKSIRLQKDETVEYAKRRRASLRDPPAASINRRPSVPFLAETLREEVMIARTLSQQDMRNAANDSPITASPTEEESRTRSATHSTVDSFPEIPFRADSPAVAAVSSNTSSAELFTPPVVPPLQLTARADPEPISVLPSAATLFAHSPPAAFLNHLASMPSTASSPLTATSSPSPASGTSNSAPVASASATANSPRAIQSRIAAPKSPRMIPVGSPRRPSATAQAGTGASSPRTVRSSPKVNQRTPTDVKQSESVGTSASTLNDAAGAEVNAQRTPVPPAVAQAQQSPILRAQSPMTVIRTSISPAVSPRVAPTDVLGYLPEDIVTVTPQSVELDIAEAEPVMSPSAAVSASPKLDYVRPTKPLTATSSPVQILSAVSESTRSLPQFSPQDLKESSERKRNSIIAIAGVTPTAPIANANAAVVQSTTPASSPIGQQRGTPSSRSSLTTSEPELQRSESPSAAVMSPKHSVPMGEHRTSSSPRRASSPLVPRPHTFQAKAATLEAQLNHEREMRTAILTMLGSAGKILPTLSGACAEDTADLQGAAAAVRTMHENIAAGKECNDSLQRALELTHARVDILLSRIEEANATVQDRIDMAVAEALAKQSPVTSPGLTSSVPPPVTSEKNCCSVQ